MKYLLFGSSRFYPAGGAGDFLSAFDSISEAKQFAETTDELNQGSGVSWAHIAIIEDDRPQIILKGADGAASGEIKWDWWDI